MRMKLNNQIVIESAAKIADTEGLDNVTLTAIAEVLGIRKPSLYNHVKGLPDLRRGLAIFGSNQLKARLTGAAVGKAKQDAIRAIAAAYRTFAHERPGLYQAIVASGAYWEDQKGKVATKELMEVLYMVIRPYNLHDSDLIHAVRGLRSVMHGFVALEASGWFNQPVSRDESYAQLVDTFIRGIEVLDIK
ncbi:MAG TPA: WHG domain-containing protein [Negativicutes bacterium]|jgi:AcrR family transcriptional regulator